MCRVFICLLIILSAGSVFSAERNIITNYPVYNNQYYNSYRPRISPDDLAALERYSMNKIYSREYPLQRLERLENLVFGAVQRGDMQTRYKNVEAAILSRPTSSLSNRRTALGNIANYFAGQATGLSPSIYPDNYSSNFYTYQSPDINTQRLDQFSNGMFGGGYRLRNQNYGRGGSVRILP